MKTLMIRIKRVIVLSLILSTALFTLNSCQDKLKEEFYNPEQQTKASFDMLFTGVLQTPDLFRQDYGSNYHAIRFTGRVLGLTSYPSGAWNARATDSYLHGMTGQVQHYVIICGTLYTSIPTRMFR